MSAGIFLIRDDHELVELTASTYDSEERLQALLARYPNLLAGDQMDTDVPRRWLLVAREAAVPGETNGGGRWSLDHLFLDQDGVPTLVEVKRSTDTRIRREVVGQMLDYAANGVAYWPVETVRAMYEAGEQRAGREPESALAEFLGPEASAEAFWASVKVNLQAGRIRMVFVADEIPAELRRVVEFLNTQMDPAEVFAVEVKQFVGGSFRGLVPRLLGQTAEAARRKGTSVRLAPRQWDEAGFFAELAAMSDPTRHRVAREVYDRLRAQPGIEISWGKGAQFGAFHVALRTTTGSCKLLYVKTDEYIQLNLEELLAVVDEPEAVRDEYVARLNAIPGVVIDRKRFPQVSYTTLADPERLHRFIDAIAWLLARLASFAAEADAGIS